MNKHLPECPMEVHKGEDLWDDPLFGFPCWCYALRAREQRVLAAAREAVAAMKNRKLLDEALANSEPEPPFVHLPGCISAEQMMLSRTFGGERYCMWCEPCNTAWNAAIYAAREAVAALDTGVDVRFSADVQADALAAIDALKEKP